jgi:hypothetical protein
MNTNCGGRMSTIDDIENVNDGEAAEHGPDRSLRDVLGARLAPVEARAPRHEGEQP